MRGFQVGAAHFVERHGLLVLVAIGESVVAVGIGAGEQPLGPRLAAVAVLGLLLSACLWWVYFAQGDDERAEAAMTAATDERRARLAIEAFGYWHLALLLGVVMAAAGLKQAVAHPFTPERAAFAVLLAAGVALFLAAHLGFRRTLGTGSGTGRALAAALALATIPLGLWVSAALQLGVLVAAIAATVALEQAAARRGDAEAR